VAELLAQARRSGLVETPYTCDSGKNYIEIAAQFGAVPANIAFLIALRQQTSAGEFEMFSAYLAPGRLAEVLATPNKDSSPRNGRLTWRCHEQLVLHARGEATTREYQIDGRTYRQMAIAPQCRLTTWSFTEGERGPEDAPLVYGLDVVTDDRIRPAETLPNIGRK
jgi:hypothetical protein